MSDDELRERMAELAETVHDLSASVATTDRQVRSVVDLQAINSRDIARLYEAWLEISADIRRLYSQWGDHFREGHA